MKKLTIADKLAKKTFESAEFQKSWSVHMAAFGPILTPAFRENFQAKVHLTAILNLISGHQIAKALDKMKAFRKYCETDADKAAFLFFLGVCFELSGDREHMAEFYTAANEYEHDLAMPYLKMGKFHLEYHDYSAAHDCYRNAIRCYQAAGLGPEDKRVLGSAYTNLASCLTMMHRYDEARDALATSRSLYPDAPGRFAVEAPLYALDGDTEHLQLCLQQLKEFAPEACESIKANTDRILAKEDPLFFPVSLQQGKIDAFWSWFGSYSETFLQLLDQQKYEQAMSPIGQKLLETFPFLEETPYVSLGKNENGFVLELKDCWAVGITHAYNALLDSCPETVLKNWQFFVVH